MTPDHCERQPISLATANVNPLSTPPAPPPRQAGSDNPNRVEMADGDEDVDKDLNEQTDDPVGPGCFDEESIKSIQRAVKRARKRDPDEINPEPYVMLGTLFLSAQLFR